MTPVTTLDLSEDLTCMTAVTDMGLTEGLSLRLYQLRAAQRMHHERRFLLADGMGLGKTRTALAASVGRVLIVASATIVDSRVWEREVEEVGLDPERFEVTAYTRLGKLPKGKTWDTVIFDEAHYLKNPTAQRTRAAYAVAKRTDRCYLLTGTPAPNRLTEMYSLLRFIFPEEAKPNMRFGSYWRWQEMYFRTRQNPFNPRSIDVVGLTNCFCDASRTCQHFEYFMYSNFRGRVLWRTLDDVGAELPGLTDTPVELPMLAEQNRVYRELAKKWVTELDGRELVNWSAAANYVALERVATGLEVLDPLHKGCSNKLDQLAEDLRERAGDPVLVVAKYTNTLTAVSELCEKLGLTWRVLQGSTTRAARARIVEEFQAGKVAVLIGQIDVVAEGLTLTASNMVIILESSARPGTMAQVKKRVHRIGQERPCFIRTYLSVQRGKGARATVDTQNVRRLNRKDADARRAMDATKLAAALGVG